MCLLATGRCIGCSQRAMFLGKSGKGSGPIDIDNLWKAEEVEYDRERSVVDWRMLHVSQLHYVRCCSNHYCCCCLAHWFSFYIGYNTFTS